MVRHLAREGVRVGRHRVRRLMRLLGLEAIYRKPRTSVANPEHRTRRSPVARLRRRTVTGRLNVGRKWCSEQKRQATGMGCEGILAILLHRNASVQFVTSSLTSVHRSDCFRLERQLPGGIRTR